MRHPSSYRHIPLALGQEVKDLIRNMLQSRVIQESHSLWVIPVILALKKDDSLWFCMGYRNLNACTHQDVYPLSHSWGWARPDTSIHLT